MSTDQGFNLLEVRLSRSLSSNTKHGLFEPLHNKGRLDRILLLMSKFYAIPLFYTHEFWPTFQIGLLYSSFSCKTPFSCFLVRDKNNNINTKIKFFFTSAKHLIRNYLSTVRSWVRFIALSNTCSNATSCASRSVSVGKDVTQNGRECLQIIELRLV